MTTRPNDEAYARQILEVLRLYRMASEGNELAVQVVAELERRGWTAETIAERLAQKNGLPPKAARERVEEQMAHQPRRRGASVPRHTPATTAGTAADHARRQPGC